MRVLYYDCFTGISGDMNLAALIDLGVDSEHLKKELAKLSIQEEYEIQVKKDIKNGITGTKVDVILKNQHHHHHDHNHHHSHRHYIDIKKIINNSDLSDFVKQRSIDTFERIAIAEAKIHGTTIDKVHFHEVGATDSIVDIVGNAVCIEYLNPELVISSPVQLGGGFVKCDHGTFPVPAPATFEITKNMPVKTGLLNEETTTPTGAAVIASNVNQFEEQLNFKPIKIGYGLGTKKFDIPNVLRVVLGESENKTIRSKCYIVECNIDDMNPEFFSYLFDKLFESGADDVYVSSIQMKKNRPAHKVSILCKEEKLETINSILLKETTTFGLRYFIADKIELERKFDTISIDGIQIKIKKALLNGEVIKQKPEYEHCVLLAKKKSISLSEAYKLILQIFTTKEWTKN